MRNVLVCHYMVQISLSFISAELRKLSTDKGFGEFKQKGDNWKGYDIFFKPHPETIGTEHPVLQEGRVEYDRYTAMYFEIEKVTATQKKVIAAHHPHQEILMNIISQESNADSVTESVPETMADESQD